MRNLPRWNGKLLFYKLDDHFLCGWFLYNFIVIISLHCGVLFLIRNTESRKNPRRSPGWAACELGLQVIILSKLLFTSFVILCWVISGNLEPKWCKNGKHLCADHGRSCFWLTLAPLPSGFPGILILLNWFLMMCGPLLAPFSAILAIFKVLRSPTEVVS